jgi:hypothetical protein
VSERNGDCATCRGMGEIDGHECGGCGGTGFDGSIYPEIGFIRRPRRWTEEQRADYKKRKKQRIAFCVNVFERQIGRNQCRSQKP